MKKGWFVCVDCGKKTKSHLPKSIKQKRCIKCRETIAKKTLLADQ